MRKRNCKSKMKTYTEYINDILESRTYTHEMSKTVSIISKWLSAYKIKYNIDKNYETQDFQLYIYENFDSVSFDIIVTMSQNLGYFPSSIKIDDRDILEDYKDYCHFNNIIKNDKKEIEYINFLKTIIFDNFNEIILQFERYVDFDVDEKYIPDTIYHVCKKSNIENIIKYGLIPKSKMKISFHPERIYLTKNGAYSLIKQFNKLDNDDYDILKIDVSKIKKYLALKLDPNFDDGYYTTTNIPPNIIKK